MLKGLKQCIINACIAAPTFIWNPATVILEKKTSKEYLEQLQLERYGRYLEKHFDIEWERAVKNRKLMVITQGPYSFSYWNVSAANNMVSLIIYSLYHGCIPTIRINHNRSDYFSWDWYFLQPYEVMGTDISNFEEVECPVSCCSMCSNMQIVHEPRSWKFRLFQMLFQRFLVLNQSTQAYVDEEIKILGNCDKMLGVLMRGTDYIKLKPAGHPVQPSPNEIIQKVRECFDQGQYSAVYVATEEKKLFDLVGEAIGVDHIRQNKRQYYDMQFYSNNEDLIGRVSFDRENDNYWKGIEYLSSLIILSRCHSLVAGNCGGTMFAVLMGNYSQPYIFNYGVYQ